MTQDETPKIQVDSDWKAEAKAEQEKLAANEAANEKKEDARGLPPADFKGLMSILASQAMMGLGWSRSSWQGRHDRSRGLRSPSIYGRPPREDQGESEDEEDKNSRSC